MRVSGKNLSLIIDTNVWIDTSCEAKSTQAHQSACSRPPS